jgi:uncharacterized protein (TIGR01370 family)
MATLPFFYQLQNASYASLSAQSFRAAVVDMDESSLTASQLQSLNNQGKAVYTYLSIGEAEDYRAYWINGHWSQQKPAFVLGENPDWPGNYSVKFWDPTWQAIMFARVDAAIALGYDGMYLDIVDAYQVAQVRAAYTGADIRQAMINFVVALSQHAKALDPNFKVIPQNAVGLLALNESNPSVPNSAYLKAIDGIGVEDLWYDGNSAASWTADDLKFIQNAINAGKFVLATSYPTDDAKQEAFVTNAINASFIPFVADRDLTGIIDPTDLTIEGRMLGHNINTPWTVTGPTDWPGGNDIIEGTSRADTLDGGAGNDVITGNGGDDKLYGGTGNDRLVGGAGNDRLDGGIGNDQLQGGAGNDTYVIDSAGDTVNEALAGSGGTDAVRSSVSFSLANSAHVLGAFEYLTLVGSANINGVGNALNNALYGNGARNLLNGGAGADVMQGGAGNDVYVVDNPGDRINEAAAGSGGSDTVQSYISFSLANHARVLGQVERLVLLGSTNINGTGNAIGNTIQGNVGNNVLNGAAGSDALHGGNGNDTLIGGLGNDTLVGGPGNDTLVGGPGSDTLIGGSGNDKFVFNAPLTPPTVDRITDFNPSADTISLAKAVFGAIAGTGVLTPGQFVRDATGLALDANDRIIYETDTGHLVYDSNGNATGGSHLIAVLAPNLALTNLDFVVM